MYDIIGDIVILKQPLSKSVNEIVKDILSRHKFVRSILLQKSETKSEFRVCDYEIIWGDKNTETICKEFGLKFKVDIRKCYYSPRLSSERMRIAKMVKDGESVLVMFSGVNPYPIYISKFSKAKEIYAIELNPYSFIYGLENIKLNNVKNVFPIYGDVRLVSKVISFLSKEDGFIPNSEFIINMVRDSGLRLKKVILFDNYFDNCEEKWIFYKEDENYVYLRKGDVLKKIEKFGKKFDRIVMPLPKDGDLFLEYAIPLIKEGGTIHLYVFASEKEIDNKPKEILEKYPIDFEILNVKKVGEVGKRNYRICIDFKVLKSES